MATPQNRTVQKSAILLNNRQVQVRECLDYLIKNWASLTESLRDSTILILAGRHGMEDGIIGPSDDSLIPQHEKLVRFKKNPLISITFFTLIVFLKDNSGQEQI